VCQGVVTSARQAADPAHDRVAAGGSGGLRSATVPDLLYALLLIGCFALLVLTMRGLERL
jgi:hypothetical protein